MSTPNTVSCVTPEGCQRGEQLPDLASHDLIDRVARRRTVQGGQENATTQFKLKTLVLSMLRTVAVRMILPAVAPSRAVSPALQAHVTASGLVSVTVVAPEEKSAAPAGPPVSRRARS